MKKAGKIEEHPETFKSLVKIILLTLYLLYGRYNTCIFFMEDTRMLTPKGRFFSVAFVCFYGTSMYVIFA